MKQKMYKSAMGTGKVLELNDGQGIRIIPGPHDARENAVALGIYLSEADLIDLGESLLAEYAPNRLASPPSKLDDRFKVGDWAKRAHESQALPELNHPVQITEVRPFTELERQVAYLTPPDSVWLSFVRDGKRVNGQGSHLMVPCDPPEPEFKIGDYIQRKNFSPGSRLNHPMRITAIEPAPSDWGPVHPFRLHYALADGSDEFGNTIASGLVKKVDVKVDTTVTWNVVNPA